MSTILNNLMCESKGEISFDSISKIIRDLLKTVDPKSFNEFMKLFLNSMRETDQPIVKYLNIKLINNQDDQHSEKIKEFPEGRWINDTHELKQATNPKENSNKFTEEESKSVEFRAQGFKNLFGERSETDNIKRSQTIALGKTEDLSTSLNKTVQQIIVENISPSKVGNGSQTNNQDRLK